MRTWKQMVKAIVNTLLVPIGIKIVRSNKALDDQHLYSISERPREPKYINIGAGSFYHPFWHNLDTPNDFYAKDQKRNLHIEYDLTTHQAMPFENESIKAAYTSHVLEHIRNKDVAYLFAEVYRCLEPGGYFRITCPDIDLEYAAFLRGDELFWKWPNAYGVFNKSIEQKFLDHFATALTSTHPERSIKKYNDQEIREIFNRLPKEEALDFLIQQVPFTIQQEHPGDHINWFNYKKMKSMLSSAGFADIYASGYGQSCCPAMRTLQLFDSTCPELSLYVECRK